MSPLKPSGRRGFRRWYLTRWSTSVQHYLIRSAPTTALVPALSDCWLVSLQADLPLGQNQAVVDLLALAKRIDLSKDSWQRPH